MIWCLAMLLGVAELPNLLNLGFHRLTMNDATPKVTTARMIGNTFNL